MALALDRERDSNGATANQSKRRPMNHDDSDSQGSDDDRQPLPSHHQHRTKVQKHVVGGGTAARTHVRVPSNKALYKHHAPSSATKLNRRHTSPSPDRATAAAAAAAGTTEAKHRRVASDQKLSRNSSASSLALKKNASHTSLKRNRSHVEVAKKNKSSGQLKRSSSNPAVTKLKSGNKTQVHFALGSEGQEDGQEDEWVDASNSASPYLSRRGSIVSSGQSSAKQPASASQSVTESTPVQQAVNNRSTPGETGDGSQASRSPSPAKRATTRHNAVLTARLLQRTPSHGAPPMMSTENITARPPSSQQHSPDSGISRETTSTLSGTAADVRPDSSGKDLLTSRFITAGNGSQGSGLTRDGSFYNPTHNNGLYSQPNGKFDGPRRPRSTGNLAQAARQRPGRRSARSTRAEDDSPSTTDDENGGIENGGLAGNAAARSRRTTPGGGGGGGYVTPRAGEISRTQQKLDLQRASSNLEPSRHHRHPGLGIGMGMGIAGGIAAAAGPLLGGGGSGFENSSRDPRLGKMLDRAEMEYLVVRRYQNPVARSIARVAQLPGADKNRRIPPAQRPGTTGSAATTSTPDRHGGGHAKRDSDANSARYGRGQSSRDAEQFVNSQQHQHQQHQGARRPVTPRMQNGASVYAANGSTMTTGSSIDTDDGGMGRMQHEGRGGGAVGGGGGGLSGSSLVDGHGGGEEGSDETMAILRNMWEKNLDLSASQD